MNRLPTPCDDAIRFEPLEGRKMFAAGALDTTFSLDGTETVTFPGADNAIAADVAVQPDGKTVAVGTVRFTLHDGTQTFRFGVARMNADGTLDKSFGQSKTGLVTFGVPDSANAHAASVTLQLDGKIVVAGTVNDSSGHDSRFAVARLTTSGLLDKSFDLDGKQVIRVKGTSVAHDVTVQADGKIVVVGGDTNGGGLFSDADSDFAIARLNPNGSPDQTFASGGKRIVGLGETEFASAVAIDYSGAPGVNPNFGKIIMVGHRFGRGYAMVRLNGDGSLDKTFSGDGSLVTRFPGFGFHSTVNGLVIQPNGKTVLVGHADKTSDAPMALVRYNTDGSIDNSFGADGNGVAFVRIGRVNRGTDVIIGAKGGLVVAGLSDKKFALAGLTRDGRIDTSFGIGGSVVTDLGEDRNLNTRLIRMAAAPNRRITLVGGTGFKTARYLDIGGNLLGNVINPGNLPQLTIGTTTPPSPGPISGSGAAAPKPNAAGRIFSELRI